MNKPNWTTALNSGGSFLSELALKIKEISVFRNHVRHNNMAIHEVLLYGADNEKIMKKHALNNLLLIYYVVIHATSSVDVCVPSLLSETLTTTLINAQKKNVKIRIVIHNSNNFQNLQLLAENGIEVKVINPSLRLEHEFLLTDTDVYMKSFDGIAVMGALDYDTKRVNCNRDATILTSDVNVVGTLKREFDRVWNSVSDIAISKID